MSSPAWFKSHIQDLKATRPKWGKGLPDIQTRAGEVIPSQDSVWIFGAALFVEKEAVRHDLLEDLRRYGEPSSLDQWLSAALTAWAKSENAAKDAWILHAVAPMGGAGSVKLLDEIIRSWIKAKEKALALLTLDALSRMNVREAKEIIPVLALCVNDSAVSREAGRLQKKQADATGLDSVEAADVLVPTLGLDPRGEFMLDYGSRTFTARLNAKLEMELFDQEGHRKRSLPAGLMTDDAIKVRQAKAAWATLKSSLKRLIRVQTRRLEDSMVHGYSWSLAALGKNWLSHPVLSPLARSLVWQAGAWRVRITEDHSFANAEDDPVTLDADTSLRVAHPLRISALELTAWRERFQDYRILQILPQLNRETYDFPQEQAEVKRLAAPSHTPLKPGVLFGILEEDGWQFKGPYGLYNSAWKTFPEENITAWITFTGFLTSRIADSESQVLRTCFFQKGSAMLEDSTHTSVLLPLSQVPLVVYSETLRRLHRLCQAAQKT